MISFFFVRLCENHFAWLNDANRKNQQELRRSLRHLACTLAEIDAHHYGELLKMSANIEQGSFPLLQTLIVARIRPLFIVFKQLI